MKNNKLMAFYFCISCMNSKQYTNVIQHSFNG